MKSTGFSRPGPGRPDQDGRFELTVAAPGKQSVRLHVEHDEYPPKDTFCYAGSDGCVVVVGDS